jgi:FPC/CPF motif-containing protein YcgG
MFKSYVQDPQFPCVGAKSALNRGRMEFGTYRALGDNVSARELCADLAEFSAKYDAPGAEPVTFIAMFDQPVADEAAFTDALWRHLQAVHDIDALQHTWDPTVSSDPTSPAFSFSIAGRAFFVVGLSPQSSRWARRSPFPCVAFNFHDQFEALKSNGKYTGLQTAIRARDVALQGFVNKALTTFGEKSEARQYAGNATPADWVCPFQPEVPADGR